MRGVTFEYCPDLEKHVNYVLDPYAHPRDNTSGMKYFANSGYSEGYHSNAAHLVDRWKMLLLRYSEKHPFDRSRVYVENARHFVHEFIRSNASRTS